MRKFYRSRVVVEVLSEDPLPPDVSLATIANQITEGDWSGQVDNDDINEEVDGPTMAKLLQAQGSDPEFFQLDDDGNDIDPFGEADDE
jgi:hypothetical protein